MRAIAKQKFGSSPSLFRWFFSSSKSVVAVVLQCLCPVAIIFAGIGYFDFRRSVIDSSPSVTEVVLSAILLGVLIMTIFLLAGGYFNRRKFLRSHGNPECSDGDHSCQQKILLNTRKERRQVLNQEVPDD